MLSMTLHHTPLHCTKKSRVNTILIVLVVDLFSLCSKALCNDGFFLGIMCHMRLQRLELTNVRNIAKELYTFHPLVTIIIGDNAKGKTNILESVYVMTHGKGFRQQREHEFILWEQSEGAINALLANDEVDTHQATIYFHITGTKVTKDYLVNKTRATPKDYIKQQVKSVLFAPEHVSLITDTPDARRSFLDVIIGSIDWDYTTRIRNYSNALYKRNKLLETHHSQSDLDQELLFWNDYLMQQATEIQRKRAAWIDYANAHNVCAGKEFHIIYEPNIFSLERLNAVRSKELAMRRTLIGPQRDDFAIYMKQEGHQDKDLAAYGSRSEQRMGVLWLKINELMWYEQQTDVKPLLLLDDIFSELDKTNREAVLSLMGTYQTIMTSAEEEVLSLCTFPYEVIRL